MTPKINLGVLFLACQLLDLIWPVLVLFNLEQVSVDLNATKVTPLHFSYYPFSHSLVMTLFYSLLVAAIAFKFYKSIQPALTLSLVVFSHWVLDFISHGPDLPLFFGEAKYGLGLWNSVLGTVLVEAALFILGIVFYLQGAALNSKKRKIIFFSLIGFLSLIYIGNVFGPKPPSTTPPMAIAGPALAMWLIVVWGYYVDRRVPPFQSPSSSH